MTTQRQIERQRRALQRRERNCELYAKQPGDSAKYRLNLAQSECATLRRKLGIVESVS